MTHIYFVRHNEPDSSWKDDRTRPLTKEGQEDCLKVLEFFKDKKIDAFYSSPYIRSYQTIKMTADYFNQEIIVDERLKERISGNGGSQLSNIKKRFSNYQWHEEDGESMGCLQKRNIEALHEILKKHKDETIIIATHGAALSSILSYYDSSFAYEDFIRFINWMPYIVELEFKNQEFISKKEHFYIQKNIIRK